MFKFYPRYLAVRLLKIYQKTLSFDYGAFKFFYPNGFCRFRPTCSDYAIQAIEKYGFIKGGFKAAARVARCQPFNPGGFDPLK